VSAIAAITPQTKNTVFIQVHFFSSDI